jgi:hypothetical protein
MLALGGQGPEYLLETSEVVDHYGIGFGVAAALTRLEIVWQFVEL